MAKIKRSDQRSQVDLKKTTVRQSYEDFLKSRAALCAVGTQKFYKDKASAVYKVLATDAIVEDLTAADLRDALAVYRSDHTEGGTFRLCSVLRAWLNWHWDEYDIQTRNPIEKVSVRKPGARPKPGITREEISKVLKSIPQHSRFPERDTAVILVLADTGLRRRSVAELKMGDVDLKSSVLTVHEKDQQYHIKPFGSQTQKAIKRYLNCLEDIKPTDPLWLNEDCTSMGTNALCMMLKRVMAAAGVEKHLFHDFRRFYGLELYEKTHDIYFVSRALDHKDVEVTKRYLAIDQIEDAERLRSVSPMDSDKETGIRRRKK